MMLSGYFCLVGFSFGLSLGGSIRMFQQEINQKTIGEIRTFLDELSNGTSNYKSLHNLTEQVEHQYHGRFLIELIQNAHDALFEKGEEGDKRRIEIVLAEEEAPFGTLYVANDGRPFTPSNFESLSKLGQSDKDPDKSIGNKGIGFRSVLEISHSPEIYSRKAIVSSVFDGYCFGFSPGISSDFEDAIQGLLAGEIRSVCPWSPTLPLVEWGEEKFRAFLAKCARFEGDWLKHELSFLSPYLLPVPTPPDLRNLRINDFEQRGFSTLVRLPLINENARDLVLKKIDELAENAILFLDRVKCFRLVAGENDRKIFRHEKPLSDGSGILVSLEQTKANIEVDDVKSPNRYWLWERTIGGLEDPRGRTAIQKAVASLPGKWPKLKKAKVAIAVSVDEASEDGVLNIYLPTELPSGCWAHFSAPFFGGMSRTDVDFDKAFNKLLLNTIAEEAVEVCLNFLAGKGSEEAAAIIDLLAPTANNAGQMWWDTLLRVFSERNVSIEKVNICLVENGWNCLFKSRVLPTIKEPKVIVEKLIRSEACYPVFAKFLKSRVFQIKQLFKAVVIDFLATDSEQAAMVEAIAKKLHGSSEPVDWNGFWEDVIELFGEDITALMDRKVLLGTDNELHASSDVCSVFFRPRSGGTDDEVITAGAIDDIPENLRQYIAFLHGDIQVHIPGHKGGLQNTPVHAYLSSGLVETFGVEQILRSVLIRATPPLPIQKGDRREILCRDIIHWGLRLVLNSRESRDRTLKLLGRLPVPCLGGWYPLKEACFGKGWENSSGKDLETYLRGARTKESRQMLSRLILPPDNYFWCDMADKVEDLLRNAGVFDGLRPTTINSSHWESRIMVAGWSQVQIPEVGPPCLNSLVWGDYRDYLSRTLTPYFDGEFAYEIGEIHVLPGMERFEDFSDETRKALMKVLAISLPEYEGRWDWKKTDIKKIGGQNHKFSEISPLFFALRELAWIVAEADDGIVKFRPGDRWYIATQALVGGLHQYTHLDPLPARISSIFNSHPLFMNILKELGMPKYELDLPTSDSRLLRDLAKALENPDTISVDRNVFIGQIRTAWSLFEPDKDSNFPTKVIAKNGTGSLYAITPSKNEPVYLPDATSAFHDGLELHSKPIVAIEPKDAKRLQGHFQEAFGEGIQLASELTMKALVDDEVWNKKNTYTYISTDFDWLPPVILSLFAFSGTTRRGTGTKTFIKAMDQLRDVHIVWVEDLAAGLWRGDECIAKTSVAVLWQPKVNTLLVLNESRQKLSQLSEGLAAVVERSDLDIPIKLVLGRLEGEEEPTQEKVLNALEELKISQERYLEVQQRWLGNLPWTIRLIKPLILVLQPHLEVAHLSEFISEDQLVGYLQQVDLQPLDSSRVLTMARTSSGLVALGKELYKILGARAELQKWNNALSCLGEINILNEQAAEEFSEHLNLAHATLRKIVRHLILAQPELGSFLTLSNQLKDLSCPREFAQTYWTVPFFAVMKEAGEILRTWGVEESLLTAITQVTDVQDLSARLEDFGVDTFSDPIEIHAVNRKKLLKLLEIVQKAAIAWCVRNEIDSGLWETETAILAAQILDDLANSVFLKKWNDSDCLSILKKLPYYEIHNLFWETFHKSGSLGSLLGGLNLSENDLKEARERLEQRKRDLDEKKKNVKVCGKDFYNTSENLENLWDHIEQILQEDQLPKVTIGDYEALKNMSPFNRRQRGLKNSRGKSRKSRGRMKQSMKDLLGLAGEIYVYRALRKTYGGNITGPGCWISENSRFKFPGNEVDDGFGCDFVINDKGKTHYIEVKATKEINESFELGSSEIQLSIDTANRRKKVFSIFHVIDAISENPKLRILPNPYDRKHNNKYRFEEAGLRIRYKTY
jgi:Protein NO VEIN, C-terminal